MTEAEGGGGGRRDGRWSLQGMTALITGGTRGIGHAVAEELAGFGASIYTCSRNQAELTQCLKRWEKSGFRVKGSVCDLSSRGERERLMEKVASAFDGKLNILINNVGTNIRKPTVDYTAEEFSFLMGTNFDSAFHLCQLAHPFLKASGMGNIVFISSVSGVVAIPSGSIYAVTKGAMNQLTKNLACEWAKDNIRINSVAPWYIKTSLVEHNSKDQVSEGAYPVASVKLRYISERGNLKITGANSKNACTTGIIWLPIPCLEPLPDITLISCIVTLY